MTIFFEKNGKKQNNPFFEQFITCLSYCRERRLVAGGTNAGNVVMWRCEGGGLGAGSDSSSTQQQDAFDDEASWRSLPSTAIGSAVRSGKMQEENLDFGE